MTTFSVDPNTGKEEDIEFSPDRRYFSVVTQRGLIQSNKVESSIWLFDSSAVEKFVKSSSPTQSVSPKLLVRMAASANDNPITNLCWAPDGQTIAFLGRDEGSERHLFVVSVRDGEVKRLTPYGQDVTSFAQAGTKFVYTVIPSVSDSDLYQSAGPTLPDIEIGTGLSLFDLLYPKWHKWTLGLFPQELWQVRNGKVSPVSASATKPVTFTSGRFTALLSLSPTGHYAIVTSYADRVPVAWESYHPALANDLFKFVADAPNTKPTISYFRPARYELVDLRTGNMSALIDAPLGWSAGYPDAIRAAWSPDEREVAVSNTFLPLRGISADEQSDRTHPCMAVIEIATRKPQCVKETRLDAFTWAAVAEVTIKWRRADQLEFRYRDEAKRSLELYQRENEAWKLLGDPVIKQAAEATSSAEGLSVALKEGINEPPVLLGTVVGVEKSKTIWNPNPQLVGLSLGDAKVYHWRDKAGRTWTGGLVKPPDYIVGHRYPLAIQTHGFNPKRFLTDGFYATANAARALASRGIVVLQVEEIAADAEYTPREAEVVRLGYESAITQLAADGLIDPRKVGIIGFSRTGWYVLDCLIHIPGYFMAATLAESTYESFGEYLMNIDYLDAKRAKGIADAIGTEPFGEGLKKWIADSPGFNTDKIQVPILFE